MSEKKPKILSTQKVKTKVSALTIVAIVLGSAGLGLGAVAIVVPQLQVVEGPAGTDGVDGVNGTDGTDGVDGTDGTGGVDGTNGADGEDVVGLRVGILDPDNHETISNFVLIRAMIWNSSIYSIKVLINGSLNATTVPWEWNTNNVNDGWWNLTIKANDTENNVCQDEVIVYVQNTDTSVIHYCSSASELQAAIDTIGTGNGIIVITEDITLSATIDVDGGGSYIIQGAGLITVDCGADRSAFDISSATYCKIMDIKIDASDVTSLWTYIIEVNEITDNPIYIENMQIIGDTDQKGTGICIDSEYVWVHNCYFYQLYNGIYIRNGKKSHIFDNTIYDCEGCGVLSGGGIQNNYNIIESNYIYSCVNGIFLNSQDYYNTVGNNVLLECMVGVHVFYGDNNIITGNAIFGTNWNDARHCIGISIEMDSDNNVVTGNEVYAYRNTGTGNAYGLLIDYHDADENTIVGNTFLNCDLNYVDLGTNTYESGNNYA